MRGVAEAASEMRRHLLDRMREGDLDRAEQLLEVMDEVLQELPEKVRPSSETVLGLLPDCSEQ